MLTFWETRRGMQLADTLIRELPKLTKKKEVVQYAATLKCEDVCCYIKMRRRPRVYLPET